MFQHFLITRINIDWHISKPRNDRNDTDFLNYRFDIFEKTCHPSVNNQTNKNFVWFLLLDTQTPRTITERIERYTSNSEIRIVFIDSKETCIKTLIEAINTRLLDSTEYIITTNVDSDDAMANNFIQSIQEQFQDQDFEYINFPFGYLYLLDKQKLYLREWLTSPIHSLIEKRYPNFSTVMKYPHVQIKNHKVRQVFTRPMWLMTSHAKNVRTKYDFGATWQPLFRVDDNFTTALGFAHKNFFENFKEILAESRLVIASKRKKDTARVKIRKLIAIFSPWLIRLERQITR